jgi:hypothetical protein
LESESELPTGVPNAIVKTQEFYTRDGGTNGQRRCQVNRVKGAYWFRGKRAPCSVHNVQTEPEQVPVRSRSIQVCPAVGSRGFIDFSECNRTD